MKRFVTTVIMIFVTLYAAGSVMAFEKKARKALILVEYQNEWLLTEDDIEGIDNLNKKLLKDRDQFNTSVENSLAALEHARATGMEVIHVTMYPDEKYRIFGKAKYGLRAAIPDAKTWQGEMKEIHQDFAPKPGEYVIKERIGASAFAGTSLNEYLRNNKINSLFIMGYALHVCVESTLRDAHDLGYDAIVLLDASCAFNSEQKTFFEQNILHHFGCGITTGDFEHVDNHSRDTFCNDDDD